MLKTGECLAKVVPKPKKGKIGPKIINCVFIRYVSNCSAYQFLVHKTTMSDLYEKTIIESFIF